MNKAFRVGTLFIICSSIFALPLVNKLPAKSNAQSQKTSSGKMNDNIYVQITGRMIYYGRIYRRKYQINSSNPKSNRTSGGISNAYKYDTSMKQRRKELLAKYGVTNEQFERYMEMLDSLSAIPEGKKKRQLLLNRAAKLAISLEEK